MFNFDQTFVSCSNLIRLSFQACRKEGHVVNSLLEAVGSNTIFAA